MVTARAGRGAREERGFILIYVAITGLLIMAIWALAYQATQDQIRVEKLHETRTRRDESVTRALATGLGLLETGLPPSDPYACIVTVVGESATRKCTVTYSSVIYPDTWNVSAALATDDDLIDYPDAPATFGS